jgi:serine/threonine protein kinase
VKIKHTNIVKYFDVWLERDKKFGKLSFYIIMECCDYSLEAKIKEMRKSSLLKENNHLSLLGFWIAIEIFIQTLEGVNHLHRQNPEIIHRDLRPANILFKEEPESISVKIGDYGLVALHRFTDKLVNEPANEQIDEETDQLHSTDVGHQDYAAPEVRNGRNYNTKADVYSVANVSMD